MLHLELQIIPAILRIGHCLTYLDQQRTAIPPRKLLLIEQLAVRKLDPKAPETPDGGKPNVSQKLP